MSDFRGWRWGVGMTLAATVGLAAAWVGGKREAQRIQFRQLDLMLPHLPPAFDGYKIAHLTDIHLDGTPAAEARLARAVAWINAAQPDAIALTGDFVTLKLPGDTGALIAHLRTLRAPDGVFAVMGNHDHKRHRYMVEGVLKAAQIHHLANAIHPLRRDDALLTLCGVDSMSRRRARLDRVLSALNRAAREQGDAAGQPCAILLAHEPDFADIAAPTRRFDLQLSGHAHGGQIRIPFVTPRFLPIYGERYSNGLYLVQRMMVYSNRGLGTTGIPIRFRCPPEVTVITLHARA
ncbi:MAG: metallophosphoesterase [Chloroflexota bacterium]|nr:metallophosphoesterase [Chloroflexota bacterium]